MACPHDSCELAARSELRTAFFDCSKSASRSIVLALERFDVFRCAILAASHAAVSMVVQLETDGLEVSKPAAVQSHVGSSLQARWFIPLEMRVISAKKEALQALRISKNVAWDALTFHFEEIEKS